MREHRGRQRKERLPLGPAWTDSGYLFDEAGVPYHPQRFTVLFSDAVAKSGVPKIRLHDTRHTIERSGSFVELFDDAAEQTRDDVSVTITGERLDTEDKIRAFFASAFVPDTCAVPRSPEPHPSVAAAGSQCG